METSYTQIEKLDKELGEPYLEKDIIDSYIAALQDFDHRTQGDSALVEQTIKGMFDLLAVSEKNLEEVKNQPWFLRVWGTVTGKNKTLERVNQINLIKAQKGAAIFMQQLAHQNEAMMKSIYFLGTRIKTLHIENIQIKLFLLKIIDETGKSLNGYSEEDLDDGRKGLLISLLVYLTKIDNRVSPKEKLLIKNKIKRLGLKDSVDYILRGRHDIEVELNELRNYPYWVRSIIYKNIVELICFDENTKAKVEKELNYLSPYLQLTEDDKSKLRGDIREYITGNRVDTHVFLVSEGIKLKITPADFKPPTESVSHGLSTVKNEKGETAPQLPRPPDTSPDDPGLLMKLGQECLEKGNYEEAKRYFEKVLEFDPQNALAYVNLGRCTCLVGSQQEELDEQKAVELLDKSIELFNKSIKLDPNNAEAYFYLGVCYHDTEQYNDSISNLRKVLKLDSSRLEAYEELSDSLRKSGGHIKVIEEYHHMLEKDPSNPYAHWALGRAYFEDSAYDKAIKELSKAIKIKSDFYEAYSLLGKVYWWCGDYQKAIKELEKAVELSPESSEAYYWLGLTYHKSGRYKEATKVYRKLKDLDADKAHELFKKIKSSIKEATKDK